MIQLAWRFLMFQKDSALAKWYRQRTANAPSMRKTLVVALARKLLIALWHLAREGVVRACGGHTITRLPRLDKQHGEHVPRAWPTTSRNRTATSPGAGQVALGPAPHISYRPLHWLALWFQRANRREPDQPQRPLP